MKKILIILIISLFLLNGCIGKFYGKPSGTTRIKDIELKILDKEQGVEIELFEDDVGYKKLINKGIDLHNVYIDNRIRLSDFSKDGWFNPVKTWKEGYEVALIFPMGYPSNICTNILSKKYSFLKDTLTTRCKETYEFKSDELNAEIEVVLESWMRHPPKEEIKK